MTARSLIAIPDTLGDLAQAIDREHQAVIGAAQTALEHAVRCGELLAQAKQGIAHGEWLPWLDANCMVRPRMAQAYMRLARELPKLPEANTQRVAHLTVRDALRAVSQNTAWIAALPESEQDDFIDLAEGTDALTQARHQHSRAKNLAAMDLAQLQPRQRVGPQPSRRKRLMKNAHEKRLMLVVGPNYAGLHIDGHVSELKASDEHQAKQAAVDELQRAAADLERQAKELRQEAIQKARELKAWTAAELVRQHGPVHPFIETIEYAVDMEWYGELAKLPEQAAIETLLLDDPSPCNHGHWGNIEHIHFARLQPGAGWTNIGNEHGLPPEVVASIIPGSPDRA